MLLNPICSITTFHKIESCVSPVVKHLTRHSNVVGLIPANVPGNSKGEKMFETIGVWQGSLTEVEGSVPLASLYLLV